MASQTLAPGAAHRPRLRMLSKRHRPEMLAGYLFILPTVLLFLVFVGYPIVRSVYLGFTTWSGFGSPSWTGFHNYHRMFDDTVARQAFRNTLVFAAVTTVLQTVLPLLVAVLVNATWRRFGIAARTLLFIPGVVSFVVSGVIWKLVLDPNLGLLNKLLDGIGLDSLTHSWLGESSTALPAIMVVSLWQALGLNMLIFFAGLQGIDPTLYEAAEVDGAGAWPQFRYVTVPGLRLVTGIVISLNLINGFKAFDLIYVMTQGGPNHASEVLGTRLYGLAFGTTSGAVPQFGYASAMSVVVLLLCTAAVVVQILLNRRAAR
ncbi:multiple sugar transport system permease protein/raffinose/stachyose/melibiose transport system permease protein [Motilibacter peucedani]|uniref:Multiple sugar transport system permease protein/raffinose/stachyose/melibiose transport system permease protein n=1 Tax=Motilibacter peucedani TaxID=598650 RepID=A0A420XKX5_9ACTN|nr:sugar ABC transporter permease [Motilibacter peucedani]RKS69190.1 multiple sugar transport system permease protein/raffinose/stachyose/melibiose transport system permease protein [Motilibacter peucedani]